MLILTAIPADADFSLNTVSGFLLPSPSRASPLPVPPRCGGRWQTSPVTRLPPNSAVPGGALPGCRPALLAELAARLCALSPGRRILAAVDGVDGAGKTMFADALAAELSAASAGRPVLRVSLDDFHHRQNVRHRRGRTSAVGFRLDSYDLQQFRTYVLAPLGPGGSGCYRAAGHCLDTDDVLDPPAVAAASNAVVLVDGLFLHGSELAAYWDFSIFLDVPFAVTAARMAVRDGTPADPEHPAMHRYVGGQRLYFADSDPAARAAVVVENSDPGRPRIISAAEASYRRPGEPEHCRKHS